MSRHNDGRRHEAVTVRVGDRKEDIDKMLAPLIRELWRAGIETMMSCQETEPDIAWIEFNTVEDFERFLNLVADYEEGVDTLYNRINNQLTGALSAPCWEYQVNVFDCGFKPGDDNPRLGPADFHVTISVYFPHCDLPTILARMKKHREMAG
jgi:hypothetical protein